METKKTPIEIAIEAAKRDHAQYIASDDAGHYIHDRWISFLGPLYPGQRRNRDLKTARDLKAIVDATGVEVTGRPLVTLLTEFTDVFVSDTE